LYSEPQLRARQIKPLHFYVPRPSFQPITVPPGDINVVTNIRPTNNRSKERGDTVYVPQHLGHNWLHLQAAKETKQTHHAETNKKLHPTPEFSRTGCTQKHVSTFPCSCIRLYIVQICHQKPWGSWRVLESQDWTLSIRHQSETTDMKKCDWF